MTLPENSLEKSEIPEKLTIVTSVVDKTRNHVHVLLWVVKYVQKNLRSKKNKSKHFIAMSFRIEQINNSFGIFF